VTPLELIKLTPLMERTMGSPEVKIGFIDGPIATQHPELPSKLLSPVQGRSGITCTQINSAACLHGTFVAGILSAKRSSLAPGICPNCTLLIRPVFAEKVPDTVLTLSTTPQELASAIVESIDAGARVVNLSLALVRPSAEAEHALEGALNYAIKRRVLVVAATGNQGTLGSSPITRHPWVIPVVACDRAGRTMTESNLGGSVGMRGLSAPGDDITSLGSKGQLLTLRGTSVAVPFVTGAIALLWSEFPFVAAAEMKLAVTQVSTQRRASVVPPLLNAEAAYQFLLKASPRR
jgi:subtilisin family serine protease